MFLPLQSGSDEGLDTVPSSILNQPVVAGNTANLSSLYYIGAPRHNQKHYSPE